MIYELLLTGERNATTARDLAKLTGLDRRGVSLAIEQERRAGFPICASCDSKHPGYYIPETQQDMRQYCSRLEHREAEIARTRQACAQSAAQLPA